MICLHYNGGEINKAGYAQVYKANIRRTRIKKSPFAGYLSAWMGTLL